jgi:[acyl-carrier-protein] S-malonyltransferase
MNALLFPGQGSQTVGMVKNLYTQQHVKALFETANNILNFDLSDIIFNGPVEKLTLTQYAQPALLTASMAILNCYLVEQKKDITEICSYVAGHSLGEYSAMVAAKALSFEDAIQLVYTRGCAMQDAVPIGKGSMAAIIGLTIEEIESCLPSDGRCVIANDNSNGQVVISGLNEAMEVAIEGLKIKGAKRCIPLAVSAPFHSPFMQKAADVMKDALSKIIINDPVVPVISNVLAKPIVKKDDIEQCLIEQICGRVRWRESILTLANFGVSDFHEVGPGAVLTGLGKRIIQDANHSILPLNI